MTGADLGGLMGAWPPGQNKFSMMGFCDCFSNRIIVIQIADSNCGFQVPGNGMDCFQNFPNFLAGLETLSPL